MPIKYNKQLSKSGAAIGAIVSIVRPDSYPTSAGSSTDPTIEAAGWNSLTDYPGWLECDGRTLNVSEYRALYSVIGNTYGGTAGSTFKLPDYRSKKICGTGPLNGNRGGSLTLTPTANALGISGGSSDEAGSTGGIYTLSTARQLPPDSEITPGNPVGSDVFFDVGGNVLGRPIEFVSGTAYQNHGTGLGETGGFTKPAIAEGNQYVGFGTRGTSPFNSTQYTREIRITNLNLTAYSAVRIFSIAGNETNGGERVNNVGEGIRVIWPNGSESVILPSAGDLGGLEIFDPLYTSWKEISVDIPVEYRTTGVTIRFRQDLNSSTNNPPGQEGDHNLTDPNAYDMIGIQKIGFIADLSLGGNAVDTFSLGSFRSQGFSSTVFVADPILAGNVTFGVGPLKDAVISGVAPHTHFTTTVKGAGTTPAPAPKEATDVAQFAETQAGVVKFDRSQRPWPNGASGVGDYLLFLPVSSIPSSGASLSGLSGASIRSYGSGTGETGGFAAPTGGDSGTQYLGFGSDFGSFVEFRTATFTVNLPSSVVPKNVDTFIIQAIAGNDTNGGERVNSQFESLKISINGSSPQILMESAPVFCGGGTEPGTPCSNGFDEYDANYDSWKSFQIEIPAASRTNPLVITLTQRCNPTGGTGFWTGEPGIERAGGESSDNFYDSFGISKIGVLGEGGDEFEYSATSGSVPTQRHSHMLFWNTPNDGDIVPSSPSTYGTGSGSNNRLSVNFSANPVTVTQVSGTGLRSGSAAANAASTNNSIGDTITKTIDVINDISNGVNPSILTLSDSSRSIFDNAIDVRLQAADPITLLTSYFRTKYIIKAF